MPRTDEKSRKRNFRAYEVFLAVCDARSITGAAKRLGISQGAVSQQILALEHTLGVKLIERHSRDVGLTPVGITVRHGIQKVFEQLLALEHSVQQFSGFALPKLRIGVMDILADVLLPVFLLHLKSQVESIEFRAGGAVNHRDSILAGDLDVIVSADPTEAPNIRVFPIARDPMVLIVPKGFLRDEALDMEVLAASLPMAKLVARKSTARSVDCFLTRQGILVSRAYEFDHHRSMLESVRRGESWTIDSAFSFLQAEKSGRQYDVYALPSPGLIRTIGLAARENLSENFITELAAVCREVLAADIQGKLMPIAPRVMQAVKILQ